MKLLCVLIAHFPYKCEVLAGNVSGRPAAVTMAEGSERLVLDYFPEAPGLAGGMSLQQALSLQGDLEVIHADLPRYRAVFNSILDALELKSPLVEGYEPGTAYLGLAGLESIYGTDDTLAGAVREALPAVFEPRLGIAEGKFLSRLAALSAPPGGCHKIEGDAREFLKDLSCDLLPVSSRSRDRLHDFGLHTLGALAAVPPAHLQAQFGPEGQLMAELATGIDDTPLYPRLSEEIIEESATLASPTVSLDLLLMALEAMLARAFVSLSRKNLGVSRVLLWTRSWISGHWEDSVRFKEPAMNPKAVLSRIRQAMENVTQPGPVEEMGMRITGTARFTGRQNSLMAQVRAQEHLLDEIKQLEFRLGGHQLFQVREVEPWSRIPERRYALTPLSR
jgi:DNA polymerase-4/protein ImuB